MKDLALVHRTPFGTGVGVEKAFGSQSPIWPLPGVTRRRWTFGASRAGGARKHAGVDLYAPRGSEVLSPEQGQIVATQRFNGPYAVALLIQLDSGPVVLLGEVEPNSWTDFGLQVGSRVEAGQPVATVGINPGGSQMLHFEMYRDGTRQNSRWLAGNPAPATLLDPTAYLQRAKALDVGQTDPGIEDDPGDVEDPEHEDDPVTPHDPTLPDVHPPETPGTGRPPNWGTLALILVGLVVLGEWDR